MYIVYASSGSFSDYGIDDVYVGEVDPIPILDELVKVSSDGAWGTWSAMEKRLSRATWTTRFDDLENAIRKQALPELERAGFRKVEAIEVHV